MDSLELDPDCFYICSEISPRNYVVQKAIQIDKSQIERMVGDLDKNAAAIAASVAQSPSSQSPAPPLPYWFTRECKEKLMQIDIPTPIVPSAAMSPTPMFNHHQFQQHQQQQQQLQQPATAAERRVQLKKQLEYYFSRENLMTDRYLRCQMDTEMYVPISVIAGFRKIVQLTDDYDLIVECLRESNVVEVDELGEKVRPITKRCTIILREIAPEHRDEVEKMLAGGPPYLDLKYGMNDSWYVTYETEEQTQDAYVHLQGIEVMFNNRPMCARIKTGGPPAHILEQQPPITVEHLPDPTPEASNNPHMGPLAELGRTFCGLGFKPVATYRPQTFHTRVGPTSKSNKRDDDGDDDDDDEEEASTPIANGQHAFRYSNHQQQHKGRNHNCKEHDSELTSSRERRYSNNRGAYNNSSRNYERLNFDRRSYDRGPNYRRGGAAPRRNPPPQPPPPKRIETDWGPRPVEATPPPVWPSLGTRTRKPSESTTVTSSESDNATPTQCPLTPASSESETRRKTSEPSCSYSYEEQAFPCLPKPKVEPPKVEKKPTFSAIAAGKRNVKPPPPEVKKSYAEKLKERAAIRAAAAAAGSK
ncbi:unnamed protein product [Caenorhabditis bovis]|uniref:HTH La-type RNA-binding domain-containing protein n=1 Tax=Caenorhabditis bovis TaxID=2654633 RepID=A0A8S1F078_9PELO|nr:unnamed protein product [Caenorhabditis bovis]